MRKECRKHLRLSLNFKVKLELPRRELVLGGHTLNLSFAGAFIKLDHIPLVLPDEYISLTLLGQVEFTCRVIHSTDLIKLVLKWPDFLDTFQDGLSPTSTTSHFPDGSRAPRDVNLRQSCSWAALRLGCCIGSRRTITSVLLDFTQPWQFVMA